MRSTTEYIRKEYGYTQKEMSKKFGIPLATIKNWDARGTMPDYITKIIIMYEETEKSRKEETIKNN